MYYIIENGKITGSSETYLSNEDGITIEKDFTSEELEKITSGYSYNIETEEFEETLESEEFEKQALISEYKTNLDSIKEISAEINEVEETKEYFPEIAEKRLIILTEKRTKLREANGLLVAEGVSKFGEEILNQI